MQAGKLRKRVQIQQLMPAATDAALADPWNAPPSPANDLVWTTVATRWAAIEPLVGRELFQAQQIRPDVSHKATLRYWSGSASLAAGAVSGINPKMRLLLYNQRRLNIEAVMNVDERNHEIRLLCKEEV